MADDYLTYNLEEKPKRPTFIRSSLRIAAEICLPLLVIVLILAYSEYRRRVVNVISELKTHETHQIEIISASLTGRLSEAVSDTRMIEKSPLARQVFEHPKDITAKTTLAKELEVLAAASNIYSQIRLFDLAGNEVVRIVYKGGKSVIVPDNELQNKKHRYYFEYLSGLEQGEIYISEMDLKKEYGEIEVPYVPTVRVGVKLYSDDSPIGLAVLSYKAELICDIFA